ncbi:MAG: hypothetical protein HC868_01130, partial [Sphingomonadales bacterium]|nr:hypothetical protein [Sphingomonadales bacterium]
MRSTSRCSPQWASTPCRWPGARHSPQSSKVRSTVLEIPLAIIDQAKYYEVTKFLSITNHTYSAIGLVMSKRTFDRMPDDIKKAIVEISGPAAKAQRDAASGTANEILERLEEQKKRHEGGNKWIGTGGTSPYGNGGYNPEGVRIGGEGGQRKAVKVWEKREYKNLDD